MAFFAGQLMSSCKMLQKLNLNWNSCNETLTQIRSYAARKGTRERKLKILRALKAKKLAREAQIKAEQVGVSQVRFKRKVVTELPEYLANIEYRKKPIPTDNVYIKIVHQWKIYSFKEAVLSHREMCVPEILDCPNSNLSLFIEFDLQGAKKTKFVTQFSRTVAIPHPFEQKTKRKVAVFCKEPAEIEEAKNAGATDVFGPKEIKDIQKGAITLEDYQALIAHPSILPELTSIKGLMKKMYPNSKDGTLSSDLTQMLNTHLRGINYAVTPYTNYPQYGHSTIVIGKLDMDIEALKENCLAVLNNIYQKRPNRAGTFIRRMSLKCSGSPEQFKLDLNELTQENMESKTPAKQSKRVVEDEDEEEQDEKEAVISSV